VHGQSVRWLSWRASQQTTRMAFLSRAPAAVAPVEPDPLEAGARDGSLPATRRSWLGTACSRAGLLVILSSIALLGGLLVQILSPRLPLAYTWLQPLSALKNVALSAQFPLVALLAYTLGALSQHGWTKLVVRGREGLARGGGRGPRLLQASAFIIPLALDLLLAPKHGPADALALGIGGALLARSCSREALLRVGLHAGIVTLLFVAVCYWFTVVKALTFVAGAQKDAQILAFETAIFGFLPHRWVAAWAAQHPDWLSWLDWTYFRIFEHMALTTALLLGRGDERARTEYVASLAICYFVGAPLYLTFPAAGPVYFDPGAFRFLHEHPLIVNQVQTSLLRNTAAVNDGRASLLYTWGYIACMPSLHLAHELVMLYFARVSKIGFVVSLTFTAVTTVAVVALGWHYPSDLVAGGALAALAIFVSRWQSRRLLPRLTALMGRQVEG
jgi:hypothetical protein